MNRSTGHTWHHRLGAYGVVAALGLLGSGSLLNQCNPAPKPAPAPRSTSAPLPVTNELLDLVNQRRAAAGVAPVTIHPLLTWAAEGHSQDQARRATMTHTGANGSNPGVRITFTGYRARAWAENVAVGYTTPAAVMEGWMNSPGHRANILDPNVTQMGVGAVADGNGRIYWTMDLAAPK